MQPEFARLTNLLEQPIHQPQRALPLEHLDRVRARARVRMKARARVQLLI